MNDVIFPQSSTFLHREILDKNISTYVLTDWPHGMSEVEVEVKFM